METSGQGERKYDLSFKILLIGEPTVGKSSLLVGFTSDVAEPPKTIGVNIKTKLVTVGGKRLKLTIWDTAGDEEYRMSTSSFYRGAHGAILVYDVTRRDTFTNLSDLWAKELELYSDDKDCVKMLVGNKVDRESERVVSKEEGLTLAKELGCLFFECSAKIRENVEQCFELLALKMIEVHTPPPQPPPALPQPPPLQPPPPQPPPPPQRGIDWWRVAEIGTNIGLTLLSLGRGGGGRGGRIRGAGRGGRVRGAGRRR